jgi:ribosomal-protein-alanine N-acetyltransferase
MSTFEWGEELPTIEGSRVRLRPLTSDDASSMLTIFGDPEVIRFWSSPALTDLAAATDLLDEIRKAFNERRLFQWGISLKDADEVLGTCTLYNLSECHRRAEVGFALRRDSWGKGLASDALEALIKFAFEVLALHRLEADVDPDNVRSRRLLERQGFQLEGRLRERWHHLGEVCDGLCLGLLKREWPGLGATQRGVAARPVSR